LHGEEAITLVNFSSLGQFSFELLLESTSGGKSGLLGGSFHEIII
jgi:hypothetical protein